MKNTPKIRFAGFTVPWEKRRLEDIVIFRDGERKPLDAGLRISGQYPYYGASGIIDYVEDYIFDEELVLLSEDGANIIDRNYPVSFIASGKYWVNNHAHVLHPKEGFSNMFVCESLERLTYEKYNTGTAQPKLNQAVCKTIELWCPSFEEQTAIGNFFETLDNTITLHKHKLEKTKTLKTAYLTEMFPDKGENKPKRRFAGFTDPWEQHRLGDVVNITMGQSPDSKNYTDNPNDHILVQGNADMKGGRVYPRVWTTQVTKKANVGDLILSVRAPVGDVGKTDYDAVIGRGVAAIKGNEFIFQTLSKMKSDGFWSKLSTGSTFDSINSSDIKEALILLPHDDEQIKIGNFFATLDSTITLHQHKLEKLQNLKKAYLHQMFV